jgi:hypothetical protein
MKEVKDALLRMVRSYRMVSELLDAYVKIGLVSETLQDAQGEIAEAVYQLLGEHTETFKDSVTCAVLVAPIMSDERKATILYSEWVRNHAWLNDKVKQPKPNTIEPNEMLNMTRKNGGYMKNKSHWETPEGDWT